MLGTLEELEMMFEEAKFEDGDTEQLTYKVRGASRMHAQVPKPSCQVVVRLVAGLVLTTWLLQMSTMFAVLSACTLNAFLERV